MYFSHKYLLRFSWFIYRSSVSVANRLFQTPKPFWSTKIRLKWQHVGQGLTPGCCSLPQPPEEEGGPGSPLLFQHTRYFWCGKLLLLPKKTLHLFLSIQISVIWNLNSYLGHFFPPKGSIFGRHGSSWQAHQLKTIYSSELGNTLSSIILCLQRGLRKTAQK